MRRQSLAWCGTLCFFGLVALATGQDGGNKSLSDLQGVWKLVSLEREGDVREFAERAPHWVVKGDKVLYGGEELATITPDAATTPKCLDFVFRQPKSENEGIYAIDGDTWKICINWQADGVKERPQVFSTKDKNNLRTLVFQRVKVKEAEAANSGNGFVGIAIRKTDEGMLFIGQILPDSPAKKAGLAKDDQILQIAGGDPGDLRAAIKTIQQLRPGSDLVMRVQRDGKENDIKIKVGLMPFYFLLQTD
jgi:uncharacterized protein (TIGR03067 family)